MLLAVILLVAIFAAWVAFRGFFEKAKASSRGPERALNPKEKIPMKLIEKEVACVWAWSMVRRRVLFFLLQEVSHDTRRFRFALPKSDQILGLPVGK